MTAPINTKTIRVQPETHETIHNMAQSLNGTADDAIRWLLNPNMVRVQCTAEQKEKWQHAADVAGMSLGEWVILRVEAALPHLAE